MKKTRRPAKPVSADAIARLAGEGGDVTHFFSGQGSMVQPIRRVNPCPHSVMMCAETDSGRTKSEEHPVGKKVTVEPKTVTQPSAGTEPDRLVPRVNGKTARVRTASDAQFRKAHRKTSTLHAGLFRRLAE